MDATLMSINRRVDKEGVVYIYNEMLVIKRKEIGSLVEIWTDLEKVTQSEVSQKEKTTIVYALNMPANLENSAVATGLEKVRFHSNP